MSNDEVGPLSYNHVMLLWNVVCGFLIIKKKFIMKCFVSSSCNCPWTLYINRPTCSPRLDGQQAFKHTCIQKEICLHLFDVHWGELCFGTSIDISKIAKCAENLIKMSEIIYVAHQQQS